MSSYSQSIQSSDTGSEVTLIADENPNGLNELQTEKGSTYDVTWKTKVSRSIQRIFPSYGASRRVIFSLQQTLRFLLPSLISSPPDKEPTRSVKLHPTAYLDGMRGLAAFAVYICHLSYGTWDITHSYGTGKPGENNWVLQLPIVRLIYSGPPMVAIFFVISGYVLSYKPVKLMRCHDYEALMTTTSSSVFRRALRLYLPCLTSTFMIACLAQLGVFDLTAEFAGNMRMVKEFHITRSPKLEDQFWGWVSSMFSFINVFHWDLYAGTTHFDLHLWTIPVEYRCSMALFLCHVMIARLTTRTRILTLVFLLWWGARWNRWDMVPFWAGNILAELHHVKVARVRSRQVQSVLDGNSISAQQPQTRGVRYLFTVVFIIGCFLASFPDNDGDKAPGFQYLNSLIPEYWTERHRFWPTIGAVLIILSVGFIERLTRICSSPLVQYLGKISFPLYVVHGTVIKTIGYMTMQSVYVHFGAETRRQLELGFFLASLWTTIVVIWVADVFWRAVDTPCVVFSRWVEYKLFQA